MESRPDGACRRLLGRFSAASGRVAAAMETKNGSFQADRDVRARGRRRQPGRGRARGRRVAGGARAAHRRARTAPRREADVPLDAAAGGQRGGRRVSRALPRAAVRMGPGGERAGGGAARGQRAPDRVGAGRVRPQARGAARARLPRRQARHAAVVQPDRSRGRSRARRLRPVDPDRRLGGSELRRGEARVEPACGVRHARVFPQARPAEVARRSAAAQLPRVQPAGRPEPRLVLPAPRQDRDDAA